MTDTNRWENIRRKRLAYGLPLYSKKEAGMSVGYFSPLRIPTGTSGKFSIEHQIEPKGKRMTVVSQRDSIFQGLPASYFICKQDMLVHKLCEDGGVWMSDCPQEIYSQQEIVNKAHGDVLIGGLGLGFIADAVAHKDEVKSVTVVEKSADVIKLVWEWLDLPNAKLVHGDLYKYLRKIKGNKTFNWGFYDIWAPTGERVLSEHIRPLRKLSKGIFPKDQLLCWEEGTMLGQIKFHLTMDIQTWDEPGPMGRFKNATDEEFNSAHVQSGLFTTWTFLNWMRQTKPSKEEALKALDRYVNTYSDEEEWLKEWGKWNQMKKT